MVLKSIWPNQDERYQDLSSIPAILYIDPVV